MTHAVLRHDAMAFAFITWLLHILLSHLIRRRASVCRIKKPLLSVENCGVMKGGVVPPGIEPGTQGFSVLCSTN